MNTLVFLCGTVPIHNSGKWCCVCGRAATAAFGSNASENPLELRWFCQEHSHLYYPISRINWVPPTITLVSCESFFCGVIS